MSRIPELYESGAFREDIHHIAESTTSILLAADVIFPEFVEIDGEAYFCWPESLHDLDDFKRSVRHARKRSPIDRDDTTGWRRAAAVGEVDLSVIMGTSAREADGCLEYVERLRRLLTVTWKAALQHQFPEREYSIISEEYDSESGAGPTIRFERTR